MKIIKKEIFPLTDMLMYYASKNRIVLSSHKQYKEKMRRKGIIDVQSSSRFHIAESIVIFPAIFFPVLVNNVLTGTSQAMIESCK